MKKYFILLLAFGVHYAATSQSTAQVMNLTQQQCIDYALDHNLDLKNAQLDAEISKREVQEILGLAYPQVSGSLEFQDFLTLPTSLIPAEFFGGEPGEFVPVQFGTQYNATAGITASQLIADGRYFLGVSATKALQELSYLNVNRSETDVVEQVQKAYLNALISQERLQQLQSNVTRFKKLNEDVKALYQSGFSEKLDADRLTVTYNNLTTEEQNVEKLVQLSYYLLKFQMGMDVNQPIILTDSIMEGNFEADLLNASNVDLNNRVEYQMLLTGKSLAEMNIKRYNFEYLPSLYGFGSFSYQAQRNEFNFFNNDPWYQTTLVGLKLNVPIFDGFQRARNVQQARLDLIKNENSLMQFTNAMNLQVASSKTNLENAVARLTTLKENLKLAEEVVTISRKKYDLGVGSTLEITDSEGQLKDAQTNYLSALYDAWVARIELQKALGTLH